MSKISLGGFTGLFICYNKLMKEKLPPPEPYKKEEQIEMFEEDKSKDAERLPLTPKQEKTPELKDEQIEMFTKEELVNPDYDMKEVNKIIAEADAKAKEREKKRKKKKWQR